MGDDELLISELNKLEKDDLIDLLVHKNLRHECPNRVINNFAEKLSESRGEQKPHFQSNVDKEAFSGPNTIILAELQDRVKEQANVIQFLLKQNSQTNGDGHHISRGNEVMQGLGPPLALPPACVNKELVGGADDSSDNLRGVDVPERCWLFVSRANPNLTEIELMQYLETKHNRKDFICKKIRPKHVVKPSYISFRVGVDKSLEDRLLSDPEVWPKGVLVKKYDFQKPRSNQGAIKKSANQENRGTTNNQLTAYNPSKFDFNDFSRCLLELEPPTEIAGNKLDFETRSVLIHLMKNPSLVDLLNVGNVRLRQLFADHMNIESLKSGDQSSTCGKHMTCCFKPSDSELETLPKDTIIDTNKLVINEVKYSKQFYDTPEFNKTDCYHIRSRNRGYVLIINNIDFENPEYRTRKGAETDEENLNILFTKMGFEVTVFRNLTALDMEKEIAKFATRKDYDSRPDMGILMIMSHGEKIYNQTFIIGSDGNLLQECFIIEMFNNKNCRMLKDRPKILIFHVCRGDLIDDFLLYINKYAQETQSDSALRKGPDCGDDRLYSDIIVCHPSVAGFQAHRDTIRGTWYMELVCKVFMERACDADFESLLKLVEKGLKRRISESKTRQTSTFLNIGFKTCYLHPGIYQDVISGNILKLPQCV